MGEETEKKLALLKQMLEVQAQDGNWNYNFYTLGMYNGLEFAISVLEEREPVYKDEPNQWVKDLKRIKTTN